MTLKDIVIDGAITLEWNLNNRMRSFGPIDSFFSRIFIDVITPLASVC
jgi:hypothetical protein